MKKDFRNNSIYHQEIDIDAVMELQDDLVTKLITLYPKVSVK